MTTLVSSDAVSDKGVASPANNTTEKQPFNPLKSLPCRVVV